MQTVRDHIDQAERRGGAIAREEVAKLCEVRMDKESKESGGCVAPAY